MDGQLSSSSPLCGANHTRARTRTHPFRHLRARFGDADLEQVRYTISLLCSQRKRSRNTEYLTSNLCSCSLFFHPLFYLTCPSHDKWQVSNSTTPFHASICGYLDRSTLNLRRESFFFQATIAIDVDGGGKENFAALPPPLPFRCIHTRRSRNFPTAESANQDGIYRPSCNSTCPTSSMWMGPEPRARRSLPSPLALQVAATLFTFLLQSVPIRPGGNISRAPSSRVTPSPFGIETCSLASVLVGLEAGGRHSRVQTDRQTDRSSRLRTSLPGQSNQFLNVREEIAMQQLLPLHPPSSP